MMNHFVYKEMMTVVISVSLLVMPTGCATRSHGSYHSALPEKIRQQIRSVAVVPASVVPENNFLTFAKGRGAGAAKGAGSGIIDGALYGAKSAAPDFSNTANSSSSLSNITLAITILAATVGATVGAIGGGISGAMKAIPADDVQKAENVIKNSVTDLNVQESLAKHMVASGADLTNYHFRLVKELGPTTKNKKPDYRVLAAQGVDAILEVTITSLGFRGGNGSDPSIWFFMKGRIRVVQTRDGTELYFGTTAYESGPHKLNEWIKDNGIQLQSEFEKAESSIAKRNVENIFLRYDFDPGTGGIGLRTIKVTDSLRPTLQWEAFPREKDRASDDEGLLNTVSDITYDLKVLKCGYDNLHPGELVYEKRGLIAPETIVEQELQRSRFNPAVGRAESLPSVICKERIAEHRIDISLEVSTCYVWTVRAIFKLDGQPRMTRWSYAMLPGESCSSPVYPMGRPYPFKTPELGKLPSTGN